MGSLALVGIAFGIAFVVGAVVPRWRIVSLLVGAAMVVVSAVFSALHSAEDGLWPFTLVLHALLAAAWGGGVVIGSIVRRRIERVPDREPSRGERR